MCGITGELRFDGQNPHIEVIKKMCDQLARRGPDHSGIYQSGPVAFGHRRLSIIDLSDLAAQPMIDPIAQLALVFNGTIYNHPELRLRLQKLGHTFKSHGDTEVILRSYAQWGEDCVKYFSGMFAFAIWDGVKKQLFCARDRVGIKPFYFVQHKNFFRFASTTQALLAAGDVDTAIDPQALQFQLTLHSVVPAPFTILKGIRKLAPAHTMTIYSNGRTLLKPYWALEAKRHAPLSDKEYEEQVHQALFDAVKSHQSIADVPVGVLLSGGLDSSLLVAMMHQQGVAPIHTFSIGFEDHPEEKGNEFLYSDLVAKHFATKHEKFLFKNEIVLGTLPYAVRQMSEPMVSQDVVAFYLLSELVAKHVKVVQCGQGADEVFGGYFWYQKMHEDHESDPLRRFSKYYFDRDYEEYLKTVNNNFHSKDVSSALVREQLSKPDADEYIDQVLRFDCTTLVVDDPVKRIDNMTMAWGLEARVPFLDHHLIEVAAKLPPHMKLNSQGKHVLKSISRQYLPDEIIDRPKGYFPNPAFRFLKGDFLQLIVDTLHSQACHHRGIFSRQHLDELMKSPETHFTRLQGSKVWHMALLELWLQLNVDALN